METTIIKIEGNKIQAVVDNEVQEYTLADWVKPEYVKLGDAVVTVKDGEITFCSMVKDVSSSASAPTKGSGNTGDVNKNWEDDIVSFEDLLKAAHDKKVPFSIKTQKIEVDLEKKYALFKAVVTAGEITKVGELEVPRVVFEGHGDATEDNVTGDFIKPHFIRLAETRAIARALRWYTNNAACAEEEK